MSIKILTVLSTSTGTDQTVLIGCWYFSKSVGCTKLLVETKILFFDASIFLVVTLANFQSVTTASLSLMNNRRTF